MPIEIRELLIKATIAQEGDEPAGSSSSSDSSANQKEEIIKECVETVLQILREKHER